LAISSDPYFYEIPNITPNITIRLNTTQQC